MAEIGVGKVASLSGDVYKRQFQKGYASGLAVGLPDGQMGNSEVGHMNIGAGRIIYQDLTRITKDIEDGDVYKRQHQSCDSS